MKGVKLILLWHEVCNTLSAHLNLRNYEKDFSIFRHRAAHRGRQCRNNTRRAEIRQSAIFKSSNSQILK